MCNLQALTVILRRGGIRLRVSKTEREMGPDLVSAYSDAVRILDQFERRNSTYERHIRGPTTWLICKLYENPRSFLLVPSKRKSSSFSSWLKTGAKPQLWLMVYNTMWVMRVKLILDLRIWGSNCKKKLSNQVRDKALRIFCTLRTFYYNLRTECLLTSKRTVLDPGTEFCALVSF